MAKQPRGKITDSGREYARTHGLGLGQVRGLTDADIGGLIVIEDNTEQVLAALDTAIGRALEAIGIEAEGDVKGYMTDNEIVDTGRLRNSITHTIDGDDEAAVVGTNVSYGLYVHEGTSKTKGRPFLREPVQQNSGKYRQILEAGMRNA